MKKIGSMPAQIETDSVTVNGSLFDAVTGSMLFGVVVSYVDPSGSIIDATTLSQNSNTFSVWTYRPDEIFVLFQKEGYQDYQVPFTDLELISNVSLMPVSSDIVPGSNPNVPVTTETKNKTLPVLLIAGAALLLTDNGNKKKKIGKLTTGDVTPWLLIAGGGIALFIVSKGIKSFGDLLVALGLSKGVGQQQTDQQLTDPGSPWKPAFWQTGAEKQSVKLLTNEQADQMSQDIFNAFSVTSDDFNTVMGVFSQLQTQSQVSYLADRFSKQTFYSWFGISSETGVDLLTFLTNGSGMFPWDGLSDAHLKIITDYVNALPKYNV